jgi:hypothetical protein
MNVRLYLMRRYGRRLSWLDVTNSAPLVGALSMVQTAYRSAGTVTVLTLRDAGNQTEAGTLATLYEPVLANLGNDILVFRGFEQVESEYGRAGVVQEWRCELATAQ